MFLRNIFNQDMKLVILGFLLTFFSFQGQTFFISLFSDQIRADFNLSHSDFALIYSSITLFSAVLIIWTGSLIDKLDLRLFLTSIILLFSLTIIAAVNFSSIEVYGVCIFILCLFLLRHLGQGLLYMCSPATIVRYSHSHSGKKTAKADMGYSTGEALLPILFLVVLGHLSWQQNWLLSAIMLLCLLPIVLLLLRGHSQRHESYLATLNSENEKVMQDGSSTPIKKRQWTRAEVLKDSKFYFYLGALNIPSVMFTGFIFHQIYIISIKEWSTEYWASLFTMYAVIAIVMKFSYGYLVDKFGPERIVALVPLPIAIALFCLGLGDHPSIALAFFALMAISTASGGVVTTPLWSALYGTQYLGAIKSVGISVMVFCSALSPVIIGYGIDVNYSIGAMANIAGAISLAVAFLALAKFRKSRVY